MINTASGNKRSWLVSVLLWLKLRQIRVLDHQYLTLNRDLDRIEENLLEARKQTEQSRIYLLKKRRILRSEYLELGGI